MKWTTRENGRKVVRFVNSGVTHNPACRTERCRRRKQRKGK